jgi:hypothetical protein
MEAVSSTGGMGALKISGKSHIGYMCVIVAYASYIIWGLPHDVSYDDLIATSFRGNLRHVPAPMMASFSGIM